MLGLYDGPSGGAALVHEGRLLAIAEEDRLIRRHRVTGMPRASVQTILRATGVAPEEIDAVLVATLSSPYAEGVGTDARPPLLYRMGTALPTPPVVVRRIRESFASSRRRRVDEALRSEFGISCPVLFVDHHLAHAVAAAYTSGHPDCLAITMDTGADGAWAGVTSFANGEPTRIASETGSRSILGLLDTVCQRIGIPEGPDRYRRLQTLAAAGVSVHYDQLAAGLAFENGKISISDELFRSGGVIDRVNASARREDVAASALHLAGAATRRFVSHWWVRSDQQKLVLGGDLFEIPAVVRMVIEDPEISGACVPPAASDAGLMVGAAFAGCLLGFLPEPLPPPRDPLLSPFLGIAFSDEEITGTLEEERAVSRRIPEIEEEVGRLLAEGRSVARFDGKTEIGNRGLGNRAILRNPEGPLWRGRLGFVVPSGAYHLIVLEEALDSYFEIEELPCPDLSQFPALATPLPELAQRCPELVGWGGNVEVQTVSRESNPRLARILREHQARTGLACLAAAPFRLSDEPLVSSPRDALTTFRLLGADYLALGRQLVPAVDPTAPLPDRAENRVQSLRNP